METLTDSKRPLDWLQTPTPPAQAAEAAMTGRGEGPPGRVQNGLDPVGAWGQVHFVSLLGKAPISPLAV